jgi:predicted aconitase with swiveling domain
MLNEMTSRGVMPLALVFNSVNPILVPGAAFAGLPMLATQSTMRLLPREPPHRRALVSRHQSERVQNGRAPSLPTLMAVAV